MRQLKKAISNGIIGGSVEQFQNQNLEYQDVRDEKYEKFEPKLRNRPQLNEVSVILAKKHGNGQ